MKKGKKFNQPTIGTAIGNLIDSVFEIGQLARKFRKKEEEDTVEHTDGVKLLMKLSKMTKGWDIEHKHLYDYADLSAYLWLDKRNRKNRLIVVLRDGPYNKSKSIPVTYLQVANAKTAVRTAKQTLHLMRAEEVNRKAA